MNGSLPELPVAISAEDARGRSSHSLDRLAQVAVGAGVAAAVALGLFGRFSGLGNFPLAVDEYYFAQGVRAILEHGVPAFETGGYYSRALLPQYLAAASVLVFGETAFAYRLPAALFSVATVPLAYVYGKRVLGGGGGLALAVLMLLSAWEIEFGRFARMYSALQFFTLLFFVTLERSLAVPRSGRRYVPHAVLLVAILTHELALLLLPFLILPVVVREPAAGRTQWRAWLEYGVVTAVVAVLCYLFFTTDLRNLGVLDPRPDDYQPAGGVPRWRLPASLALPGIGRDSFLLLYLGSAAIVAAMFGVLRIMGRPAREYALLGSLLVLSAAFHQFFLAGLIGLVLLARHPVIRRGPGRPTVFLAFAASAMLAVWWLGYAVYARESGSAVVLPGDGSSKAIARVFFGWPDITSPVIGPWRLHLPLISGCAIAALVFQLIAKGREDLAVWAKHPATVVVPVLLAFGMINQAYTSIRYSFFLYPFVLAVLLMTAIEVASGVIRRWGGDRRFGQAAGVAACLCVFGVSSDFNLLQITGVAGPDVRLRLGAFERYQGIWYDRLDYETPARFVNAHVSSGDPDRVLVVGLPPASYYLRVPHAVYYDRADPRYYDISRHRGTIDVWSNQRLLSTPADLREYTRCAARVWIVRAEADARQAFDDGAVWGHRIVRSADAFRSLDGRLVVRSLELESERGCPVPGVG